MSALCHSVTCPARRACVRNAACPDAAPRAPDQESAIWYPQAGRACPGFVEPGLPWWQRMARSVAKVRP